MEVYAGLKVKCHQEKQTMKVAKPVKIHKSIDKFGINLWNNKHSPPATFAKLGSVLMKEGIIKDDQKLSNMLSRKGSDPIQ